MENNEYKSGGLHKLKIGDFIFYIFLYLFMLIFCVVTRIDKKFLVVVNVCKYRLAKV